jgi:hypothetical protein
MCGLPCLIVNCYATTETKITYLDLAPVEPHEDVRRLQISMDHVPTMQMHQTEHHLRGKAANLLIGKNYTLRVHQGVQVAIHKLE